MQYTKSMIDLIFRIRKASPAEIRPRVKLSSDNLLATLTDIYRILDDEKLKLMIYELMIQAGPEWAARLQDNRLDDKPGGIYKNFSVHRGKAEAGVKALATPAQAKQAEPEAMPLTQPGGDAKPTRDKVVIYRGRRMVIPA